MVCERLLVWVFGMLVLLAGCGTAPPHAPNGAVEEAAEPEQWTGAAGPLWKDHRFPGKSPSVYRYTVVDARPAVSAQASSSASMWRRQLRIEPDQLQQIHFSWKVPALITNANLSVRETDDSPVRLVLAFDGDRSRFSLKNTALSDLSQALTGEELPYATLMYVWCNQCEVESVIVNPRTDRIRKIAVESGTTQLNQWRNHVRDIRADFERAYGEAPGALIGVALMTDSDNTRSQTRAWYGPVSLGGEWPAR